MDEPDPEVVAAARGGDTAAFEQLVRRYQGHVWRMCVHLLHDEDLASDVTQDSFVRAFRFLPRFRGEARFTTWLFSIARNCAIDELRRQRRRDRIRKIVGNQPPPAGRDISVPLEVRDAVAALDQDSREVVVLIDMFGMTYGEVARMSGVPIGTVKSRMHRARRLLAESLQIEERGAAGES